MKPVLIFGAGQVAEVFAALLADHGYRVAAYIVDPEFADANPYGAPVVRTNALESFAPAEFQFVVGMSFRGLNKPRAAKYRWMVDRGYEPLTFIDRRASVGPHASVGPGSFVMDENTIQPFASIGENTILWSGNHVGHHTKIGSDVFIASHAVISGAVEIGARCFVGVNATIRDGVKIGEGCVIGAGALILKDCEPDGLYKADGTERQAVPASRLRRI